MTSRYPQHFRYSRKIGSVLLYLVWPWPALRRTAAALISQREQHRQHIAYIRDLARQVRQTRKPGRSRKAHRAEPLGFEENWRRRAAGAPNLAQLRARFLRQKRAALGTALCFTLLAAWALVHGNLTGIATLLACLPLCFMSCLSAQLRLWQLRTRRLSMAEGGGLGDFMREEKHWAWRVLDPRRDRAGDGS